MIKQILIKNFMAHTHLSHNDLPAINVIIGKNDTGKTGLLKLLYASAKTLEIYSLKYRQNKDIQFKKELAEKMLDTFMPRKGSLGELVQKGSKDRKLDVEIDILVQKNLSKLFYSFGEKTESNIAHCVETVNLLPESGLNALFIPAKEVLTAFNDIRNIRENFYGRGFDDTYLDLIKALSLESTRGRVADNLSGVNKSLINLFDGKIEQTGLAEQPFIFKKGNQQFSMQQTAEGIKKIGILTTLITNRQLSNGTILFMDEPETALHPSAIRQLVNMLVEMGKGGVQIFIATHSYFVLKQMAICARRDKINISCWNLKRQNGAVTSTFQNLIDGILPENEIITESLDMYDEDIITQFA